MNAVAQSPVSALPDLLRLTSNDGSAGVLLATRCPGCGATAAGIRRACPNCCARDVKVIECSPRGRLTTYAVVHRATQSWSGRVPYVLGEVELPEGALVTAEVIGAEAATLRRGVPMRLELEMLSPQGGRAPLVIHRWTPDQEPAEVPR